MIKELSRKSTTQTKKIYTNLLTNDLRTKIAYHEAAHVVMFRLYGYYPEAATIDDHGNGYVFCNQDIPSKLYNLLDADEELKEHIHACVKRYVLIHNAGYVAEFKYMNKPMPFDLITNNDDNDFNRVLREIKFLSNGNDFATGLYLYQFNKRTKAIIRNKTVWACIEEIAQALIATSYLDEEQLYEIYSKYKFKINLKK